MLLTSAHIVFTLGDVAQASNFRFQTLTLLFSFFPELSFERIFCLDWSFFPKSMDTALHITFLFVPGCFAAVFASTAKWTVSETQHSKLRRNMNTSTRVPKYKMADSARSRNQNPYLYAQYLQFLFFFASPAGSHKVDLWFEFTMCIFLWHRPAETTKNCPGRGN